MVALLALLFLAKSLVPLGFMPSFNQEHTTAITICSGINEIQIFVNDQGERVPNSTSHQSSQVCEFSLASIFTPYDVPAYVVASSFILSPVYSDKSLNLLSISAHQFHARAPPALLV